MPTTKNSEKRWKTVLVGVGRMGRNHLRVLSESQQFFVAGVVDPGVDRFAPLDFPKTLKDLKLWKSVDDCLRQMPDFEVAVVAAPTLRHHELALQLISAGKHVLIEKPLATTHSDAIELVDLARRGGTALKVGHLERLNPAVTKLKEVITAGWIGKPIHFSFTRVGGYPAATGATSNVLMDLAVHDVDVLHALVGVEPGFKVRGAVTHSTWQPGVLDTAEVLLESPASVSASIHVNWVTPTKIRTVRVTGTRGVCLVDYILQTVTLYGGDLLKNRHEPKASFKELIQLYQNTDRIEFGVNKEEPLAIQLREFHKALAGRPSLVCDGTEAAAAVDIVERALLDKPTRHKAAA